MVTRRGYSIGCFVAALLAGGAADAKRANVPVTNAAGATAQYYGGPVTENAKVYVVWWGDPSKINSAVTAAKGGIADYYAGVTNSSFMDWLNQYNTTGNAEAGSHSGMAGTGQRIGRGNYAGTITLAKVPSGNVTDDQIRTAIDQGFVDGVRCHRPTTTRSTRSISRRA